MLQAPMAIAAPADQALASPAAETAETRDGGSTLFTALAAGGVVGVALVAARSFAKVRAVSICWRSRSRRARLQLLVLPVCLLPFMPQPPVLVPTTCFVPPC